MMFPVLTASSFIQIGLSCLLTSQQL